jgi:pimeloyl-ACP methyl ester carboxylesterase
MLFLLHHGYRVIAHDRRGHGRSPQVSEGNDMDHYADDLAALTAHLDLHDAIHVGHSAGGGEVARYVGRHGESRVAKVGRLRSLGRFGTNDLSHGQLLWPHLQLFGGDPGIAEVFEFGGQPHHQPGELTITP